MTDRDYSYSDEEIKESKKEEKRRMKKLKSLLKKHGTAEVLMMIIDGFIESEL